MLFFPKAAVSHNDESLPTDVLSRYSPPTSLFVVDVTLAFGPSSAATWDPSLGIRWQINDNFRIGLGDVSFGSADLASGSRYAIMGGPVIEYFHRFRSNCTGSILVGAPLQTRWGAGIDGGLGVAPYGLLALDYHFSENFALAAIGKIQYVATEAYLRMPRVLPSSSLIIGFGLGTHFYF